MSLSLKKNKKAFIIIFSIFIVDQLTKYLVLKYLYPDKIIKLLPFLNLLYVENTGTVFGILKFMGSGFFILIALMATAFLLYLLFRDSQNWITYSLLIGGALGNISDRIMYGYVIDFIDVHVLGFHWPAFNVADSSISIGIFLFLFKSFKR